MNYELMIVATSDKGDSLLTRVEKALKQTDAKDVKVDRLGRKPLAYVIKKQTDANYYIINFDGGGKLIKPIVDQLKLEQEDLLRYLLIKKQKVRVSKKKIKKVEEEKVEKPKPKVTVAVKKTTAVKSTESKSIKSTKSTRGTKGKSK